MAKKVTKKTAKKTAKLSLQSVLQKKSDLLVRREVDNSIIVLNLESNRIFQIDGVAIEAWEMIDGKKKVSAISTALMEKHDWSAAETNKLVLSFCETLQKQDLVEA
jgi:hypothetical protein